MTDTIQSLKTKLASIQEAIKKNVEVYNTSQANINKLSGALEAYQDSINELEKDSLNSMDIEVLPPIQGETVV